MQINSIILIDSNDKIYYYPKVIDKKIYDYSAVIKNSLEFVQGEKIYENENLKLHCKKSNKFFCMCVSTLDFPSRIEVNVINNILNLLENENAMYGETAINKILKTNFEYGNNLSNDKIYSVQKDIDEVKDVMLDSIDKTLKRGENIDMLNSKTQSLAEQSNAFYNKSYELKKNFCMRNLKSIGIITCVLTIMILLIVLIAKK
jgi:hypothetical protein